MYHVLGLLTKSFMKKLMTRFQLHPKYTFLLEQHKKNQIWTANFTVVPNTKFPL